MKRFLSLIVFFHILLSSKTEAQNFSWAKSFIGPNNVDEGKALTIDGTGNIVTTGTFQDSVDFDPGPAVFNLFSNYPDGYVCKIDPSGNIIWVKHIPARIVPYSITSDLLNNIYIAGALIGGGDFDPGPGTFNMVSSGFSDGFILKLDPSGNFIWAKFLGGSGQDYLYSMSLDPSGNILTTGHFTGTADFDPGVGTFNLVSNGMLDLFISKIDPNGNFISAWQIGGIGNDEGKSITCDITGNIYLTGGFTDVVDFDPNTTVSTLAGNIGAGNNPTSFILKLNNSGIHLWSKNLSGGNNFGNGITTDISNNIIVCGNFIGPTDFDPGPSTFSQTSQGSYDAFFLKLNTAGNFIWAGRAGWNGTITATSVNAVLADPMGNLFFSGTFSGSCDFDPSASNSILLSYGSTDIFILKLDALGNYQAVNRIGGTNTDVVAPIKMNSSGEVYLTGYFNGYCDFDPSFNTFTLNNAYQDIFIEKLNQITLGVSQNQISNNFIISPNPNNGYFDLTISKLFVKTEIKIFNSLGQIVSAKNNSSTDKISLSISDQPSGIYFVEVTADGESYRAKVVKE